MTRTGTQPPDICNQCFDRYCWNGTVDSRPPGNYVPQMKLQELKNAGARGMAASVSLSLIVALVVGASLL
jgi:lysophospholipase